jgi:para-aminobenzoate synthetase / 4-amino-4-deoxychorismate lyase
MTVNRDDQQMANACDQVILHDSRTGTWLNFSCPETIITTTDPEEVLPCLDRIEGLVNRNGWSAAGMVSYEAAGGMDEALATHPSPDFPLLWFGLYQRPIPMQLPQPETAHQALNWREGVDQAQYIQTIERIHRYIEAGDCYQVNYTFRNHALHCGDLWQTFLHLIAAQNPQYGAFLTTRDWAVLSSSPELFFTLEQGRITSLPMKGTIDRGPSVRADARQRQRLRDSIKDQAENVMIVDMVRNDLARIAQPGSVRVDELFTLQRFPTLWQMISRVSAQTEASLADLFKALFPAASITGAPKARTMEIIRELEPDPRRIYTGTLGYLLPQGVAQFNVAIRTMLVDRRTERAEYGVGGGITYDSTPLAELAEARVKSKICRPRPPSFALLETLRWTPDQDYWLLDLHLDRLLASAGYFDYPCKRTEVLARLTALAQELPPEPQRVRLLLHRDGGLHLEYLPLPTMEPDRPWVVILAPRPVDRNDPFLYHKTTQRTHYQALRQDLPAGVDDVLLYNEQGEVTESTIANLIFRRHGQDLTPPADCGLLAGTRRQDLIERNQLHEQRLTIEELPGTGPLFLVNSVRDRWPVRLQGTLPHGTR